VIRVLFQGEERCSYSPGSPTNLHISTDIVVTVLAVNGKSDPHWYRGPNAVPVARGELLCPVEHSPSGTEERYEET